MSKGKYFGSGIALRDSAGETKEALVTAIDRIGLNAAREGYVLDWSLATFETSVIDTEVLTYEADGILESYSHLAITVRGVKP